MAEISEVESNACMFSVNSVASGMTIPESEIFDVVIVGMFSDISSME